MAEKSSNTDELVVTAGEDATGRRLDQWLAGELPDLSRSRLQILIREGQVCADGKIVEEVRQPVEAGVTYKIKVAAPEPAAAAPEAIRLNVVFEDDWLIVIDKPAGLVVHPGAGHSSGTLVNALINHCGDSLSGIGGVMRPGIVHRLDKDTSGLLVVAKHDASHAGLSEQFKSHGRDGRLQRRYQAIVWGHLTRPAGTVDVPLARSIHNRKKIVVVRNERVGRSAITHFKVVSTMGGVGKAATSLVEFALETGRTHQIRVHAAHIGHPILGDPVYGSGFKTRARFLSADAQNALTALGRQALHAATLGFEHPKTGERLHFESALPTDLRNLLNALEQQHSATD